MSNASNARSAVSPTRHITPSTAAHQFDKLIQDLEILRAHMRNHSNLIVTDPTTPSAQLTGTGNSTFSIDIVGGIVVVDGVALYTDPSADYALHSGSYYPLFANGESAIVTLVAKNDTGTVSLIIVKGASATTGSQVAPTDAEIQTAAGAGIPWVKVAEMTFNRTGDTTMTESQDNTKAPMPAVNRDSTFGDWSAIA